jgi:two-component system response regulator DesR
VSAAAEPASAPRPASACILIVDEQDVVHVGLRAILGSQPWVGRILGAREARHALRLTRRFSPDLILIAPRVGGHSAVRIAGALSSECRRSRPVLMCRPASLANTELAAGLDCVDVSLPAREIVDAVHAVLSRSEPPAPRLRLDCDLTPREREVLTEMCTGATNREIAQRLCLSRHTVKEHTQTLFRKLGARNRTQAVLRAERLGLTDADVLVDLAPPATVTALRASGG